MLVKEKSGQRLNAVRESRMGNPTDPMAAPLGVFGDGNSPDDATSESGGSALKVSRKDVIYLVGQLSIMFETGLNLMTALECLAQQARTPAMKRLVNDIRKSIGEGTPLWVAMSRHPKVFRPISVSMVRSGEISSTMGQALARLEVYLEREEDIRTRVRSALSYPVFMLVFAVGVLIFLLTFVFPKFEVMFAGREDALPGPTRFFLVISHACTDYWYIIFPTFVVLVVAVIWCWRLEGVKKLIDPLLVKVPLLGDLIIKMSLSRSFHTLAVMLNGGIPILDALRMAKDVAGNSMFAETWSQVSVEVENGRDFAGPVRENPCIPPSETQMIAMGDSSGKLPAVLSKLSGRYEKEIDLSVKGLIRFVEPTLVIVMGFVVGLMVLSLVLPIFAMSRVQR